MVNEVKKVLELAYEMHRDFGKNLGELLDDPKDVEKLITRQKEYDEYIYELAENEPLRQYLNEIINTVDSEERTKKDDILRKISAHVALVSKDKTCLDLSLKHTHIYVTEVLPYCNSDIVEYWMEDLLQNVKEYHTHLLTYYADFIARNNLKKYVKYFFDNEEKFIIHDYDTYLMLAYTQDPKAKETLLEALITQDSFGAANAANALLVLGEEAGMQYFRQSIVDRVYQNDTGREIAIYGNRADLKLDKDYFAEISDDTDVLTRTYLHGGKELIPYYYDIIVNHEIEEAKEIAHLALAQTFLPEDEFEDYADMLDEDEWDEIAQTWKIWIEENYDELLDQRYYENKEPFRIKTTLEEVKTSFNNPIGFARWQRLAIYTGQIMPFDPMAYYEKQLAQNKAMEDWIDKNSDRFPDGRWYRFGNDVTDEPTPPLTPKAEVKKVPELKLSTKAPKTGRYRASLPNTHPQAKQLQSDPHSYARFKKDDTFTYEGLEEYELSQITWSYIGD